MLGPRVIDGTSLPSLLHRTSRFERRAQREENKSDCSAEIARGKNRRFQSLTSVSVRPTSVIAVTHVRSPFDHTSVQARPSYADTVSMSDTVTAIIGHRLGKVEAVRRLKEGLARTKGHLGPMIAMEEEIWEGDTLSFRMRALGQNAAASIEVLEDALRIEVSWGWGGGQATQTPNSKNGKGGTPGHKN
jgi:hypothetical protein